MVAHSGLLRYHAFSALRLVASTADEWLRYTQVNKRMSCERFLSAWYVLLSSLVTSFSPRTDGENLNVETADELEPVQITPQHLDPHKGKHQNKSLITATAFLFVDIRICTGKLLEGAGMKKPR